MKMGNEVKVRVYTVERGEVSRGAVVKRSGTGWVLDLGEWQRYPVKLLRDVGGEQVLVNAVKMVYKERYDNWKYLMLSHLEEIPLWDVRDGALLVASDGVEKKAMKALDSGGTLVVGYGGEYWRYVNRAGEVRAMRCEREPWIVDVRVIE
jgi:hypothetical protein